MVSGLFGTGVRHMDVLRARLEQTNWQWFVVVVYN